MIIKVSQLLLHIKSLLLTQLLFEQIEKDHSKVSRELSISGNMSRLIDLRDFNLRLALRSSFLSSILSLLQCLIASPPS